MSEPDMAQLRFLTDEPPNAGVSLSSLDGAPIDQETMYLRNSFAVPEPGRVSGRIAVTLPDRDPEELTPQGLATMPQTALEMVLECAGNGRSLMSPVPEGLPWDLGGVSPIVVSGVRLIDALVDIPSDVVDLVFTGADSGEVWPEGEVNYQFSIDAELARSPIPLLATHVGDEPLGLLHGGPVRLIVPGHYAMRSVKWLTAIDGLPVPFNGHFVNRYQYLDDSEFDDGTPVGPIQVRSVIATPGDGDRLPEGPVAVAGSAWSGLGQVTLVEVSIDGTWVEAELTPGTDKLAATAWHLETQLDEGPHTIEARATDSTGATQPLRPRWNKRGYANNLVHEVSVYVG